MVNYIGIGGPAQIGGMRKSGQTTETQKTDEAKGVQFESTLQEAQATGGAESAAESERAQKIAELKAQVDSGVYQPDMHKVSSSLLQFLVENK